MKKGDLIRCRDADDMIKTMTELAKHGIETDFRYETKDGKLGLWLEVIKVIKVIKVKSV